MSLYPRVITEYLAALSIPRGPDSRIFLVDTENGVDTALGDRWTKPLKTLIKAEDKCVADRHDTVLFLARDTADEAAETIAWDKDHTHLVGLSGNLPGLGQRCRVVGTAALDLTSVIDFSGIASIVRNMHFSNGADANVDSEAANISGDRCEFTNVMFAGGGHVTPAARAGTYSLGLNGAHENLFKNCYIGIDTVARASTMAELVLSASSKNLFKGCKFVGRSEVSTKFLVRVMVATDCGINSFEECSFVNMSQNMAVFLTDAFNISGAPVTWVIDLFRCRLIGVTGWADVVTHVYSGDPVSNAGFGVSVTPTT